MNCERSIMFLYGPHRFNGDVKRLNFSSSSSGLMVD